MRRLIPELRRLLTLGVFFGLCTLPVLAFGHKDDDFGDECVFFQKEIKDIQTSGDEDLQTIARKKKIKGGKKTKKRPKKKRLKKKPKIEDIEDVEDVEDAEDIEDVEDVEDVEDIEDVEDVEDVDSGRPMCR